jgi:hypothetical protein
VLSTDEVIGLLAPVEARNLFEHSDGRPWINPTLQAAGTGAPIGSSSAGRFHAEGADARTRGRVGQGREESLHCRPATPVFAQ